MTSTSESYSTRTRQPKLAPGTELQNRYRVVRQLGKGGMGAVYEAIDLRLDATVAIKEAFSSHARLRKQFEHEARLLAQLNHPALPRVTDYFCEGERVFLVMQFIEGDDLAEIIAKQPGPMPRNTVVAWADQLLDALIYLHTRERQIIHRDIKPHNLKLTAEGKIALLDFGLAKADSDSAVNSTSSVFGFTRRYSPPEQMQDQGTSPQSDIYALGATLYHLLTGVKPPDALVRANAIAKSQPDPLELPSELYPGVGPEISAMLLKAMELNPARRFNAASEFRQALKQIGREDMRALQNWTEQSPSDAVGRPNINVTVVKQPATIDPFDSYSILKPVEMEWLIPKPSRVPFVVIALIGVVLVGGVFAFADRNDWPEVSKAAIDYVKAKSVSDSPKSVEPTKPARPSEANGIHFVTNPPKNSQREPRNRKASATKRVVSKR